MSEHLRHVKMHAFRRISEIARDRMVNPTATLSRKWELYVLGNHGRYRLTETCHGDADDARAIAALVERFARVCSADGNGDGLEELRAAVIGAAHQADEKELRAAFAALIPA